MNKPIFTLALTVSLLCKVDYTFAEVTLDCARPAEPVFDHADDPTRAAVLEAGDKLHEYTQEVQTYVRCLNKEVFAERDRLLKVLDDYREENKKFREALRE